MRGPIVCFYHYHVTIWITSSYSISLRLLLMSYSHSGCAFPALQCECNFRPSTRPLQYILDFRLPLSHREFIGTPPVVHSVPLTYPSIAHSHRFNPSSTTRPAPKTETKASQQQLWQGRFRGRGQPPAHYHSWKHYQCPPGDIRCQHFKSEQRRRDELRCSDGSYRRLRIQIIPPAAQPRSRARSPSLTPLPPTSSTLRSRTTTSDEASTGSNGHNLSPLTHRHLLISSIPPHWLLRLFISGPSEPDRPHDMPIAHPASPNSVISKSQSLSSWDCRRAVWHPS